ncbi:25206_t:CDS:2, partial [Racocetra persica]
THEPVKPFLQPSLSANTKFIKSWASKQIGSHMQPTPLNFTKMPLNPGKSAAVIGLMPLNPGKSTAVIGLSGIYDNGKTESDSECYFVI